MKRFTVIIFLLCFVRKAFNFEVNSCDDDEDKVLVATKSRSISIGCHTDTKLSYCSIAKVGSSEKCSFGICNFGHLYVQYREYGWVENVCLFELSNLDISGVSFKIFFYFYFVLLKLI